MVLDERDRIHLNLQTIRDYLVKGFVGFQLTEDASDPTVCHRFTMTDLKTFQQYKLKVSWSRLGELTNSAEKLAHSLFDTDVASKMREAKGHYWHW